MTAKFSIKFLVTAFAEHILGVQIYNIYCNHSNISVAEIILIASQQVLIFYMFNFNISQSRAVYLIERVTNQKGCSVGDQKSTPSLVHTFIVPVYRILSSNFL